MGRADGEVLMPAHFVLTVIGMDKPGILASVSRVLFDAGCNVEDSSMTMVRGAFAMLMVIAVPEAASPETIREAIVAEVPDVNVFIRPATEQQSAGAVPKGKEFVVSVYGSDRPGIVHCVSRALADLGVNITDLKTKVIGDPERPVYVMVMEVDIPPTLEPANVDTELKTVAAKLSVNLTFRPREGAAP